VESPRIEIDVCLEQDEALALMGEAVADGLARCGSQMRVVSVITEPAVVDRILRHLRERGKADPFEGRAPPAA